MKQDGLYIDDCWMLEMKKSALLYNYFDSIQKFKKDELPKKILIITLSKHSPAFSRFWEKISHQKGISFLHRLHCSKCVWKQTWNYKLLVFSLALQWRLLLCPIDSCDCVSLQDRRSVLRSTVVDYPSGYPRWDPDAGSLSIYTMEGKSYLAFEF